MGCSRSKLNPAAAALAAGRPEIFGDDNMNKSSVVIIGAGLSGLYAAFLLEQQGLHDYVVLESRHRLGGRLLSETVANARFDLGATWYWPDLQPQLDALVRALGLETMQQQDAGMMVFEQSATSPVQRFEGLPADATRSLRIEGGMAALVDALAAQGPWRKVRFGHRVRRIEQQGGADILVEAVTDSAQTSQVHAGHVLLALPPRLAIDQIAIDPGLPPALARAWAGCPTWMAPHAKYLAVYPRPFWREQGLSGSGRSYAGPLVEIHDASPPEGPGALFGFVGVPASARQKLPHEALLSLCRAQMGRLFGPQAQQPLAEWLKDWSQDADTATSADFHPAAGHATAPPASATEPPWKGRLVGIASEWSPSFAGYVAGAIDAAQRGTDRVIADLAQQSNGSSPLHSHPHVA